MNEALILAGLELIKDTVDAIQKYKSGAITDEQFKAQIATSHATIAALDAGDAAAIAKRWLVEP